MNSGGGGRRQEAERWLGVGEKLLEARDIEGCKQFVEQAVSADPLVPGAEEIVAAAEVLQAVQIRRVNGHPDYYAVLGLDSSLPSSLDPAAVSLHYHRLSLLLHRDPPTPAFSDAARLVEDAWTILSDPPSKTLFDRELKLAKPKTPPPPPPRAPSPTPSPSQTERLPKSKSTPSKSASSPKSKPVKTKPSSSSKPQKTESAKASKKASDFWTMCTTCCHAHLYGRLCEGQYLLCHSCNRPFFASAMSEPPPIVPDSDMYYCSWGFFPLGFPGGPGYGGMMGPTPMSVPGQTGGGIGTPGGELARRRPGRPRKNETSPGTIKVKVPVVGTPISESGRRGRGRPRKSEGTGTKMSLMVVPLGQETGTPISEPVKRGRGRPPKIDRTGSQISPESVPVSVRVPIVQKTGTPNSERVRRGRGRPPKIQRTATQLSPVPLPVPVAVEENGTPSTGMVPVVVEQTGTPSSQPVRRGRGRPRKSESTQEMVAEERVIEEMEKVTTIDIN